MSYTTCERRGWDAPCSELGELEAALEEARRERDALVRGITDLLHEISGDDYLATSSLPLPALTAVVRRQVAALAEAIGDLAVYRAANLTCGQSLTTLSLGMAPTHTQGCGLVIADGKDVFRCRDCEVPFHRSCLNRHCDDELATERAALAEARRALEDARATIRNLREVVVSNQDARRDVENLLEQCGRSLAEAQRDRDEAREAAEYAIERCTESHIIASLPCERCRPWRATLGRPAPDPLASSRLEDHAAPVPDAARPTVEGDA